MKKHLTLTSAALALCLAACAPSAGFSDGELLSSAYTRSTDTSLTYNYQDGATTAPLVYNTFCGTVTDFGLKLFRRLCIDETESFAFSPAETAMQLSLLTNGASGDTKQELILAVGEGTGSDGLNSCSSYFKSRLQSVGASENKETGEKIRPLVMDGSLLIDEKYDVNAKFLRANADYCGDDIIRFDFEDSAGKLSAYSKSLGYPVDLTGGKAMVLTSSFFISDSWLTASKGTAQGSFEGKAATFVNSDARPAASEKADAVIRYTEKSPLKAIFILPKSGVDFDDYVRTFDSAEYFRLIDSEDHLKTVSVNIPELEIPAKNYELRDILISCGLSFLAVDPDFGNLSRSEGLTLDSVKTYMPGLKINAAGITNTGTEAAFKAAKADGKAELSFDRRFMFILADNESNIPIVIGIY